MYDLYVFYVVYIKIMRYAKQESEGSAIPKFASACSSVTILLPCQLALRLTQSFLLPPQSIISGLKYFSRIKLICFSNLYLWIFLDRFGVQ